MLKINVNDWNGTLVKELELNSYVFDSYVNEDLIAHVVRWQMAKSRSGNHETLTRADVNATTKKSRGQKETGRARQGSLKAPHHRGGGVVFGPHKRSHAFKLNKKVRQNAARSVITTKFQENNLFCINDFSIFPFNKTKDFNNWLKERKIVSPLFVFNNDFGNDMAKKVMQNIIGCDFILTEGFNVLSCLKHREIFFDLKSIKELEERYALKDANSQEKVGE